MEALEELFFWRPQPWKIIYRRVSTVEDDLKAKGEEVTWEGIERDRGRGILVI